MAAAAPEKSLQEEIVCSVCLDNFQDPVTTSCGHNFCRSCINSFWNGSARTCPQCRAPSLRREALQVNTQLANIVASVKQLRVSQSKPQEGDVCEEHDEKLKLFCKDDLKLICIVCDRSVHHRNHAVVPVAEALQEYKTSVQRLLVPLKRNCEDLEVWITEDKERCAQLKRKCTSQRINIQTEFAKLHLYWEAQKQSMITSQKKDEKGILKNIQQKITQLEEQHSSLQNLILETENKSDLEFLKDVKNTMLRCGNVTVQRPEADSPEDEKILNSVLQQHSNLIQTIQEFRVSFPAKLEWRKVRSFAATVTLDPDTANPWLILSEDGKSVTFGDKAQDLPKTRERYDTFAFVLGRERLTSGRYYWEIRVGRKTSWTLGVCDESKSRKGNITLEPQRGYWVVRLMDNKYQANTSPCTPLTPCVHPHVVGVFLDYETGLVSFYNVEGRCLLFSFAQTLFPQTLRLCLSPSIVDGGRNTGALEILPVTVEE